MCLNVKFDFLNRDLELIRSYRVKVNSKREPGPRRAGINLTNRGRLIKGIARNLYILNGRLLKGNVYNLILYHL